MGRVLGNITQPVILSRRAELAVADSAVIDGSIHEDELLLAGQVLGKTAGGKYRAYAEAVVATGGAFSASAAGFTVENAEGEDAMKYIRVGDVIESVAGDALGTVATFDPVTGVGTLTGNSANALAAGQRVRVAAAGLSIAAGDVRILTSETSVDGDADVPAAGYFEGFFSKTIRGATAAALTAMGAKDISSDEFRLV